MKPAGRRDGTYRSALSRLDWQTLYKKEDGFLLFEDTKIGWEEELHPDYVLIDSRTGDTDVLGICTRQLPDSVVLMFTPNEQNLAGLEHVVRDIRREETEGLKKKIRLHFVAANVPDLDDPQGIVRRQLHQFHTRLEFDTLSAIVRRYEHLSLLDQSIFTIDHPETRLARTYRRLHRKLLMDNPADRDGAMLFLKECGKRVKDSIAEIPTERPIADDGQPYGKEGRIVVHVDVEKLRDDSDRAAFLQAIFPESQLRSEEHRHLVRIAERFNDDIEILQQVADCFILKQSHGNAIAPLDRVLELNPNMAVALFKRALCNVAMFQVDAAAEDLLVCLRVLEMQDATVPGQAFLSIQQRSTLQHQCLERLSDMPPAKLAKLAEMVRSGEIQEVPTETVASYLCVGQEGVPLAAELLRWHVAKLKPSAGE